MSSTPISRGGPTAIRGIEYQMLWSLLRAVSLVIQNPEYDDAGSLQGYTLVLETSSGADAETQGGQVRLVDQVKMRTTGDSWGLGEVIDHVLSNLFHSVNLDTPSRYRFVTEGKMGDWGDLYEFFQSLRGRCIPQNNDLLSALDERPFLEHHPQLATRVGEPLSERSLFRHIAERVGEKSETAAEIKRKLWSLLANFEFLGGRSFNGVVRDVDRALTNVGVPLEAVAHKRDELVGSLLALAMSGESRIEPHQFLKVRGLADVALRRWTDVLERSRKHLCRCLLTFGYDREADVREVRLGAAAWNLEIAAEERVISSPGLPVRRKTGLILAGESGQGKSWRLFGLADELAESGQLALLIRASGSPLGDWEEAARSFCREIWKTSYHHTLSSLSDLVRVQVPHLPQPWLTVLIDGVQDPRYGTQLLQLDWQGAGIRVAFTCSRCDEIEGLERAHLFEVGDFTRSELSRYLRTRLGDEWVNIPEDVRSILRRPLLARLFSDLHMEDPTWRPMDEYQLFERSWRRYASRALLATNALADLASKLLKNRIYPWPLTLIRESGLRDSDLQELLASGVVRLVSGSRSVEIWHDRILNWAVAEGLVAEAQIGRVSIPEIAGSLFGEASAGDLIHQRLGYIVMDVLWLATAGGGNLDALVHSLLVSLEEHWDEADLLRNLRTLGYRIAPYAFSRIRSLLSVGESAEMYVELLKKIDDPMIPVQATSLLKADEEHFQEAAVDILSSHGSIEALDRLWELRCSVEGAEDKFPFQLELDRAIYKSVRRAPEWIVRAIRRSDPSIEPFGALIYALPWVEEGRRIWAEVREEVFEKIASHDERAVAVCIEDFEDEEGGSWLRARIHREHDLGSLIAPAALRALERLSPDEVLGELQTIDLDAPALALARSWWLPQLLATQYETTSEALLGRIRAHPRPWIAVAIYDGRENFISGAILELLLEETGRLLVSEVARPSPENKRPLYRPFHFLSEISRLDLLEHFAARRGTRFEDDLMEVLLRHGPSDLGWHRWEVDYGLSVLLKIGGKGFARVASQYVHEAKTRLGLRDALMLFVKRPAPEAFPRLYALALGAYEGDEEEKRFPLVQYEAVKVLATLGRWRELVQGIIRLGLRIPRDLSEFLAGRVFEVEEIEDALRELRSGAPSAGALIALGLSHRAELAPRIRAVMPRFATESDEALACLIALEELADQSDEAVALFVDNLRSPKSGFVAWRALLGTIRSPRAHDALLEQLKHLENIEGGSRELLTMNLLRIEETRSGAAQIMWQRFEKQKLLRYAGDTIQYFACLDRSDVQEFLREVAFSGEAGIWRNGHRYGAILGLTKFDRDNAFDAALALFRSEDRSRDLCPAILLDLDETKALQVFQQTLQVTEDFLLVAAMGEALDHGRFLTPLLAWFTDQDPALRQGACFVAECWRWSDELDEELLRRIRDPDWNVRVAARAALEDLRIRREADSLVEAIRGERDPCRQWILVDAALKVGYPGVIAGYGAHNWFGEMCRGLPYALRKSALSRLEEKRKKLRDELAKRERS